MTNKEKGNLGEDLACCYLQEQGQKIIKRNFKRSHGEVDIISEADNMLIFIEVKSWNKYGFEDLEYAIDEKKQWRIIKTAMQFIVENPQYDDYSIRFDIIFLSGRTGELCYLPHAFEGDGAPA